MNTPDPMHEFIKIDDRNHASFEIAVPIRRRAQLNWYIDGKKNGDLALLILNYLDGHGTLFDVGANIGMISLPVAVTGSHVLGVELVPENCLYLHLSVMKNRLSNVRIFQAAAGYYQGITGYAGEEGTAYVTPTDHPAVALPLDDIADLAEQQGAGFLQQPVFLKIDTEGYELNVLKGASRIFKDINPIIAFESITIEGSNLDREWRRRQVKLLLEDQGYHLNMYHKHTLVPRSANDLQEGQIAEYIPTREKLVDGATFCRNIVRPLPFEESLDLVRENLLWSAPYRMHAAGVIARWLNEGREDAILGELSR
jgi:FkbM family methyltransferase